MPVRLKHSLGFRSVLAVYAADGIREGGGVVCHSVVD